ncbi:hypothetical protein NNJEOMEG_01521 [Fundidesulfovibrio magnetotacticus]|uniref:Prepilin type IV endopeptidase peptidase domain-containing protein n=2 Tax=Fundidesulfovibrio magnetotacticus TaxID=2730080 RepID=A0A6V8LVI8_9BACT|nr:hypothetical protein NNJEOMEG_01521 [Fundidesulfovibrio magnetotacticus]
MQSWLVLGALCVPMLWAAWIDYRSYRIPNRITYPSMLCFVALNVALAGLEGRWLEGLFVGGAGLLLAGGCMLPPFLLGVMGAGDVKLMAVSGAALGPGAVLTVLVFTALAGGVQAALTLGAHMLRTGSMQNPPKVCYGVAIAVGTLGAAAWRAVGGKYIAVF